MFDPKKKLKKFIDFGFLSPPLIAVFRGYESAESVLFTQNRQQIGHREESFNHSIALSSVIYWTLFRC